MKALPLLLTAVFGLATSSALLANEAPLELRLIVPKGMAGSVEKILKGGKDAADEKLFCAKEVLMDSEAVSGAQAFFDPSIGWCVMVGLTDSGKKRFTEISTQHVHERIGILAFGYLMTAPMVQAPLTDSTFMITGRMDEPSAKEMAAALMKKTTAPEKGSQPGAAAVVKLSPNPHRDPATVKPMEMKADAIGSMIARQFATAQVTYPEARKRFLAGLPPGEVLTVQALLGNEIVGVTVQEIHGDQITGVINSRVNTPPGQGPGDRCTFALEALMDWHIGRP